MKKLWFSFYTIAFLLLPLDSYPLGAQLLREFGARPTNFILAVCLIVIFLLALSGKFKVKRGFLFVCTALIAVLAINYCFVDASMGVYYSRRPPVESFIVQSMVFIWAFISCYIWFVLFKKTTDKSKEKCVVLSAYAVIALVLFDSFLVASKNYDLGRSTLGLLQFYHDPFRVSGPTSEPSILGAWIAFLWPLLYLGVEKTKPFTHKNILAIVLILLGCFFGGRTFLMLFGLQGVYLILRSYSFRSAGKITALMLLFVPLSAFFIWFSLTQVFDIESSLSSMARLGSTITAFKVGVENFPEGIGIGQFSYYFPSAVPTIFLRSAEVVGWASGENSSRLSTFNMPARIFVELGLIGLIALFAFALFLFRKWFLIRTQIQESTRTYVILNFIAGCGFWLSQDQFGYQPAIFSLALIFWVTLTQKKSQVMV